MWWIRLGSLFGVKIRAHLSVVLLLGTIGVLNLVDGNLGDAINVIVRIMSVYCLVLTHELGHALMARRVGVGTEIISMLPIGGIAEMGEIPRCPYKQLMIIAAGPAVNAVGFVVFGWLYVLSGMAESDFQSESVGYLGFLAIVNLIILIFNLLPVYPMDGGRIFRALLQVFVCSERTALVVSSYLGQIGAVGFVIWGLNRQKFMLALIGIFLFVAAKTERHHGLLTMESRNG